MHDNDSDLQNPSVDDLKQVKTSRFQLTRRTRSVLDRTERTHRALESLISAKLSSALPVRHAQKQALSQYIRYTPSQQGAAFNSGAKQRLIQMVEVQRDPMEPSRFKTNQKIPRGPPSPPAPILHSPTREVTVKEQQDWKIPPCISNWINAKGYTIPLEKRLAGDGRGLQSTHINEKFAQQAEALNTAHEKICEEVNMRAKVKRHIVKKKQEENESQLQQMAINARMHRAGIQSKEKIGDESAERDQIRQERQKERQRTAAAQRVRGEKRNRLTERDISEKIALNVQCKKNTDVQYDQRLFNMSAGIGRGLGDEEAYNVYDQPWNSSSDAASAIYKPSKPNQRTLEDPKRFQHERNFKGVDRAIIRYGPVQFQRIEEDLVCLGNFLKEVRHSCASTSAPPSSSKKRNSDDADDREDNKRRRK